MNKKIILVVIIILLLIGGGLVYLLLSNSSQKDGREASTSQKEQPQPPQSAEQTPTPNPGGYIDYSKDALASTSGTKLLFFHAPWCSQCRDLEKRIKNSDLPEDLTIFKIDYDSNQELRQKYGVTLQTTFVKVDDTCNKITSYVAYEEPNFTAVKQNLLP